MEITAKGNQLTVKLNGEISSSAENNKLKEGFIALQFGSGIIKFRKILIKNINN